MAFSVFFHHFSFHEFGPLICGVCKIIAKGSLITFEFASYVIKVSICNKWPWNQNEGSVSNFCLSFLQPSLYLFFESETIVWNLWNYYEGIRECLTSFLAFKKIIFLLNGPEIYKWEFFSTSTYVSFHLCSFMNFNL